MAGNRDTRELAYYPLQAVAQRSLFAARILPEDPQPSSPLSFLRSSIGPVRWPAERDSLHCSSKACQPNRTEPPGLWLREAYAHATRALPSVRQTMVNSGRRRRHRLKSDRIGWRPVIVTCAGNTFLDVPLRKRGGCREFNSTLDDVGLGSLLRVASIVLWELWIKKKTSL